MESEDVFYSLAFKLQKDIIDNLTENSIIYYPILQFNSYSLIKIDESIPIRGYTISMERLNITKKHLYYFQNRYLFKIQNENKFNFLANFDRKLGITCVNEYRIFQGKNIENNEDKAFPINIEFTHERMGHAKEIINNKESPKIYFNRYFKNSYIERVDKKEGEAGKVIENFILNDDFISLIKKVFIFGEFMNYKYFVQSDFKELKNGILRKLKIHYPNHFKINSMKKLYKLLKKFFPLLILLVIAILLKIFKINDHNILFTLSLIIFCVIIYSKNKKIEYKQNYLTDFIFNDDESDNENILIYPDDFVYSSEDSKYFQNKIKKNWSSNKGKKVLNNLDFENYRY